MSHFGRFLRIMPSMLKLTFVPKWWSVTNFQIWPKTITKRLWKSNKKIATPHSTNVNQTFMEENFPQHTPTLHRFNGVDDLFFPPKLDDFWPIERLWAILAQRAFRHPRPERIDLLMRRVRETVTDLDVTTLTKLVHEMPARMQEIYAQKGKKIPAGWKARNSRYRCRCSVCNS